MSASCNLVFDPGMNESRIGIELGLAGWLSGGVMPDYLLQNWLGRVLESLASQTNAFSSLHNLEARSTNTTELMQVKECPMSAVGPVYIVQRLFVFIFTNYDIEIGSRSSVFPPLMRFQFNEIIEYITLMSAKNSSNRLWTETVCLQAGSSTCTSLVRPLCCQ